MQIRLNFDGACNNVTNTPMPMGIGVAVFYDNVYQEDVSIGMFGGLGTSNVAEWRGCLESFRFLERNLEKLGKAAVQNAIIQSDSQLITNQYNRIFKIKEPSFGKYFATCRKIAVEIGWNGQIEWVRREFNTEADKLSKKGLKV